MTDAQKYLDLLTEPEKLKKSLKELPTEKLVSLCRKKDLRLFIKKNDLLQDRWKKEVSRKLPEDVYIAYRDLNEVLKNDKPRKFPNESLHYTSSMGYEIAFMKTFNRYRSIVDISGLSRYLIEVLQLDNWDFLARVSESFDKDIKAHILLAVLGAADPNNPRLMRFVMLLIENGAVIDNNVFQYAIQNSNFNTVDLLVEPGAHCGINLNDALKIALETGKKEVINLLLDYGASARILTPTERRLYMSRFE